MAVKKITRRWLLGNFAVIVLIIILAVVAAGYGIYNYYYENVRQTLLTRADIVVNTLSGYIQEGGTVEFPARLQGFVASFSQRTRMELMTINGEGEIALTSSGFEPDDKALPDYRSAMDSPDKTGRFVGNLGTERVMAVSVLIPVEGDQSLSAIRLVTSLEYVDQQIALFVVVLIVLGIGILILILFSSSYFINSIVNPVGEVGETARKIAGGDFAARLERKSDDEIGELCDIINYMAEELGAAEKLKNDFISSVSHELRTPLTAIQGWGETLLDDRGQNKQILERGMNVIIGETSRLSSMVEELLDFSRMQSGRLKLIRSKTDAMAELAEAVMMYTEKAKRESIALIFDDDGLPAPVYGDKNKLRQVFVNVIDNAIKYSDAGGTVRIAVSIEMDTLSITVKDSGIGIKPEDLPKIKTKFYKANSTRRGSGIGLAVADEIISRHGGSLTVDSEYGKGTTVEIVLPLYKGSDETAQIET